MTVADIIRAKRTRIRACEYEIARIERELRYCADYLKADRAPTRQPHGNAIDYAVALRAGDSEGRRCGRS